MTSIIVNNVNLHNKLVESWSEIENCKVTTYSCCMRSIFRESCDSTVWRDTCGH